MEDREGFWCARCLRCYTTKFRFNSHFENKNVQGETGSGGRMHPNECYNSSSKQFGSSKKKAMMLKRQTKSALLSKMFKVASNNTEKKQKCTDWEEDNKSSTRNKQPQDCPEIQSSSSTQETLPETPPSPGMYTPMPQLLLESTFNIRMDELRNDHDKILQLLGNLSLNPT